MMEQGEVDKKEQLELNTDEYIANFDFFVNCSEQPKDWLDWLKVLGLSVTDAKRIDEELSLLPDREIANAELAALSLTSNKYFISTQDILLENILPPSCYADKIRLAVLKRVLMANKLSNPQDEWQANQDNKIRHKLTEINRLLGYQPTDEQQADAVEDVGTGNHAGTEPRIGHYKERDEFAIELVKDRPDLLEMRAGMIKAELLKASNIFTSGIDDWWRDNPIFPKSEAGRNPKN